MPEKHILIKVTVPAGYEDCVDEIVFGDFMRGHGQWETELMPDLRDAIAKFIKDNPGAGTSDISGEFGIELDEAGAILSNLELDHIADTSKKVDRSDHNDQEAIAKAARENRCEWKEDEDGDFDTSCDNFHCFSYTDGPIANGYVYCPYCGKLIAEK